jgi:hypothetical protein
VGEGFETRGAVFGFVDLAGAKAMQQRAKNSSHVSVIVDDEKAQTVEIDTDHSASRAADAATIGLAQPI